MNTLKLLCLLFFLPLLMQGQNCGSMALDVDIDWANTNNSQKCYDFTFTYSQGVGYLKVNGRYYNPNNYSQRRVDVYVCFPRTNYSQTISVDCYMEGLGYSCPEVRHDGSVVTIEPGFIPPPSPNPPSSWDDPPCGGNTGIICP